MESEDQAEDVQRGTNRRGDEFPDELQRRESRLKKIREQKSQHYFTDPDSRIMRDSNKGWDPCGNAMVQGFSAICVGCLSERHGANRLSFSPNRQLAPCRSSWLPSQCDSRMFQGGRQTNGCTANTATSSDCCRPLGEPFTIIAHGEVTRRAVS